MKYSHHSNRYIIVGLLIVQLVAWVACNRRSNEKPQKAFSQQIITSQRK